jgi:hypothetical protein
MKELEREYETSHPGKHLGSAIPGHEKELDEFVKTHPASATAQALEVNSSAGPHAWDLTRIEHMAIVGTYLGPANYYWYSIISVLIDGNIPLNSPAQVQAD